MFVDSHCHLDFPEFDANRDEVIKRAKDSGVSYIINVGSDLNASKSAVELSQKYDFIYSAVGVHPHDAESVNDDVFAAIKGLAKNNKVVAIGEVGLDYYAPSNQKPVAGNQKELQRDIFTKFIILAKGLNLPLIVHSRDAAEDMISILKEQQVTKGVVHCFSGDEGFLKGVLSLGLYISFAGNITFKKADNLRELAKKAPVERLLLETDAPFLAPQPLRGKRNEPSYIKYLAEELARLYGLSVDDISRITTVNAKTLFGIGKVQEPSIVYAIRNSLYINVTNRCTDDCAFCVRGFTDYVKGYNLRIKQEPSVEEAIKAVEEARRYEEVVFCGYGEPTLRLDFILQVSRALKEKGFKNIRLITNGHGNLINKRSVVKELSKYIDAVSISLHTETKDKYNRICRPSFGENTFDNVLEFVKECKALIPKVEVTFLEMPEADIAACKKLAAELNVDYRIRKLGMAG